MKLLTLIWLLLTSIAVCAQTASISIVDETSKDKTLCLGDEGTFRIDVDYETTDEITLYYGIYAETNGFYIATNVYIKFTGTRRSITLKPYQFITLYNDTLHYEQFTVRLQSMSTQTNRDNPIVLSDEVRFHVWRYPEPEIMNDEVNCGLGLDLLPNYKWADDTKYLWEVSTGTLDDATKASPRLVVDDETYVTLTLTETTGLSCSTTVDKTVQLRRSPTADLRFLNDSGVEDTVRICTNIVNDPAYDFDGELVLTGHEPFNVSFSNGVTLSDVPAGTTTHQMRYTTAGMITVESVSDANGCVAADSLKTGGIVIEDRTPQTATLYPNSFVLDTLQFAGREIQLSQTLSTGDRFYWSKAPECADYDVPTLWSNQNGDEAQMYALTNMTGLATFQYIEVEETTGLEMCSDTVNQVVNVTLGLREPTGFSPNGDGKNDRLVFEGLPLVNHLLVTDAAGEMVFETDNYRNDWTAEGCDDGYYYYILTGEGISETKHILAIKRE